jgi:hypothetical protein
MRVIIFTVILWLLTGVCFKNYIFAQEKVNLEAKMIGSTFKTLAKAFVVMADVDKLKKNNIEKLSKMDEEKFRKRYAKVYEVAKDLPPKFKDSYGITGSMSREQVIRNIKSLDKKKICQAIDSVPDTIIARQFRQYLGEKNQEMQKSELIEQINGFWNKMMRKVNLSSLKQ